MKTCDCLPGCPFFNDLMDSMPEISGRLKKSYCLNSFETCARHMVKEVLGKEAVPNDLFPNHKKKAMLLLKSA